MKQKIEDVTPKNNNGELHGYQELYFSNKIQIRGHSKNGEDIGYNEYHSNMQETEFHIR